MARHYASPAQQRKRALKEGRGTGRGETYKPFLKVREVPSHGRSTRIKGKVSGRCHHVLSDNERSVLLSLDNAIGVADIREQVPLCLETTVRIAAIAGIRHPTHDGELVTLTTDIVVEVPTKNGAVHSAITVKPAKELDKIRVIEKLEIERRYWSEQGVSWQICTDKEMTRERAMYDLWLHDWHNMDDVAEPHPGYWSKIKNLFLMFISSSPSGQLDLLIKDFDRIHSHQDGHCLAIIRHLLATKQLVLCGCHFLDRAKAANQLQLANFALGDRGAQISNSLPVRGEPR